MTTTLSYELIDDGFVLIKNGEEVLRQTEEPEAKPGTPLTVKRAEQLAKQMIAYIRKAEQKI